MEEIDAVLEYPEKKTIHQKSDDPERQKPKRQDHKIKNRTQDNVENGEYSGNDQVSLHTSGNRKRVRENFGVEEPKRSRIEDDHENNFEKKHRGNYQ